VVYISAPLPTQSGNMILYHKDLGNSRSMSLPRAQVLTILDLVLVLGVEPVCVIAQRNGMDRSHGRWLWPISRITVQRK
jgi:hypothetical protein